MIVVDVNVVLAAFRSSRGASHLLLQAMLTGETEFAVSPAVALEYEDMLRRPGILGLEPWLTQNEIDMVLVGLFSKALLVTPWYLFRPFLDDADDDIYNQCALAAGATWIISSDRHFAHPAVAGFGLKFATAGQFLARHATRRTAG